MSIPFPKVPTRLNLPKKLPTDLPSALAYIQAMTTELQSHTNDLATYVNTANLADLIANQPEPGLAGRTFYGTDNLHFYVDDGTSWILVV